MRQISGRKSSRRKTQSGTFGARDVGRSRLNVLWTISARPSNPLRTSVWPVTSHTRAPLGIGIIGRGRRSVHDPHRQSTRSPRPHQRIIAARLLSLGGLRRRDTFSPTRDFDLRRGPQ